MAKKVPDTSDMSEEEQLVRTLAGLMGRGGNYIEAQEAQGQQDLVASEQLPVEGTEGHEEEWAKIGVRLLPIADPNTGEAATDIFRDVVLPAGWKKVPTEHSMWSSLVDEHGSERASIFYKAAFYDRRAFVRLNCRYNYQQDYDAPDTTIRWIVTDARSSEPLYVAQFDAPSHKTQASAHFDKQHNLEQEHGRGGGCVAWLESHFPVHHDPTAYWE